MADEVYALDTDSDRLSDELLGQTSDCGSGFPPPVTRREVDYVEDSPTRARSSDRARSQTTARRLIVSDSDEDSVHREARETERERLPPESDAQTQILEELKRTNSRLESFSDHLEALDCRLKSVEQMQLDMSASTSSSASSIGSESKSSRKVPAKVAVSIYTFMCNIDRLQVSSNYTFRFCR